MTGGTFLEKKVSEFGEMFTYVSEVKKMKASKILGFFVNYNYCVRKSF